MVELICFEIRDALEDIGKIIEGVDAIEFAGFNNGVNGSSVFSAMITSSEQIILTPNHARFDFALSGVVINVQVSMA